MDKVYNGGLTREQFLYFEIKVVCKLISQGYTREEIAKKIKEENLFQFPTEKMVNNILSVCFKRIDAMDSVALVEAIANEPAGVGKQINVYAMMKYNRVVWDFMTTVIGEKYRTQEFDFSKKDVNVFFNQLCEQSDEVAKWSEPTINKIKQVLVKTLVEAGFLESRDSEKLNMICIEPVLEDAIKEKNETAVLASFNCFQ